MEDQAASATADSVLRLLGLARRAGKLMLGSTAVLRALRKAEGGVVFLARDAGADLRRKIERNRGNCRLAPPIFSQEELATAFGKRKLAVVSVHDRDFVSGIEKHLRSLY